MMKTWLTRNERSIDVALGTIAAILLLGYLFLYPVVRAQEPRPLPSVERGLEHQEWERLQRRKRHEAQARQLDAWAQEDGFADQEHKSSWDVLKWVYMTRHYREDWPKGVKQHEDLFARLSRAHGWSEGSIDRLLALARATHAPKPKVKPKRRQGVTRDAMRDAHRAGQAWLLHQSNVNTWTED